MSTGTDDVSVRHHIVSQFYLRMFAANRNKPVLYVVDRNKTKPFTTGTTVLAVERHFHTVEAEGERPDIIERKLAEFEGVADKGLRKIVARRFVGTDEHALNFLFWATLLLVKSPSMRRAMDRLTDEILKRSTQPLARDPDAFGAHLQEMIEDGSMPADTDVEGLRKELLLGDYKIELTAAAHMDYEFPTARDIFAFVARRSWTVLMATEGQFITSDSPVIADWGDALNPNPIGLGLKGSRILIPLSPSIAIEGGAELSNEERELSRSEVARVNGRIANYARQQVYARDDSFEYRFATYTDPRPGSELISDQYFHGIDKTKRVVIHGTFE